jgi:hypothetical protein
MAKAKPVQPAPDRGAVNRDAVDLLQLEAQFVQRQVTFLGHTPPRPVAKPGELAAPRIALTLRRQPSRRAPQLDHVIHEFRRGPEMPRRLTVRIAVINEGNNPLS